MHLSFNEAVPCVPIMANKPCLSILYFIIQLFVYIHTILCIISYNIFHILSSEILEIINYGGLKINIIPNFSQALCSPLGLEYTTAMRQDCTKKCKAKFAIISQNLSNPRRICLCDPFGADLALTKSGIILLIHIGLIDAVRQSDAVFG